MKKQDAIKMTVRHLDFIYKNNFLSTDRKLEQGFGFVQGVGSVRENLFDEITEIWETWRSAVHPAYTPTYSDFKKKYNKYF